MGGLLQRRFPFSVRVFLLDDYLESRAMIPTSDDHDGGCVYVSGLSPSSANPPRPEYSMTAIHLLCIYAVPR